jgi:two-component system nitrate/nitrite sensor histidine kinase NarX
MSGVLRRVVWKWIAWGLLAVAAVAVVWLLARAFNGAPVSWALVAALLLAAAGWGAALIFRRAAQAAATDVSAAAASAAAASAAAAQDEKVTTGLQAAARLLAEAETSRAEETRRLQAALRINRSLAQAAADAATEHDLMRSALSTLTELVGALGCSFVPVDEWNQPLPPFTFGELPPPVLSAWSVHLASGMLRERCGACSVLKSTPGGCPLHPQQVGNALTVFCLPANSSPESERPGSGADGAAGRPLGVLHLYMPSGKVLDDSTRRFLDALLPELALAYEAARMRSQELVTLRQLQMLRSPEGDFAAPLGSLLDSLLQALETDIVLLRLRPGAVERLSSFNVQRGALTGLSDEATEMLLDDALGRVLAGSNTPGAPAANIGAASTAGSLPAWLALPLSLPEDSQAPDGHRVLGMLFAGSNRPFTFHARQQAIMQTVAAQSALLVENERLLRSLEYKVVIQERARLAREIHDGLAQTLAYLKLQSAQMQSYLAQGNLARLSQVLDENYQALADAYLDTRQAIDNLRLTPQESLETWVMRAAREFESASGLPVELNVQPLERAVMPEVQAQLIRIVQEALSNIRKHARARHARVSLHIWSGALVLEVADDGVGFDSEDVPEVSRHGLRGMRERTEMIGADFQVISQAHQGTTVRLVLPAWMKEEPS